MMKHTQRAIITLMLTLVALTTAVSSASAGPSGIDPASCGSGETWRYRDFNVNGAIMRQEVRHADGCNRVGWGRLSWVDGSRPGLALVQTAWNIGGPSQDGVAGTNWTKTVDASLGKRVCAGFQAWSVDGLGRRHYIGWFDAGCYTA